MSKQAKDGDSGIGLMLFFIRKKREREEAQIRKEYYDIISNPKWCTISREHVEDLMQRIVEVSSAPKLRQQ